MAKEKSSIINRVLTIIGTVMCVILAPILIMNITLIVKSYINRDEVPSISGYLPMIVLTDSMYPGIESGDLIICHAEDAEEIDVGDVISFFDPAGSGSSVVTHRVIEMIENDDGINFRTKGDNNNAEDKELVPADHLVGVYQTRIAGAGNVAMFMQSATGLIICVVLPIILLVAYDTIRHRIYEKNRQDDKNALLAELEALRAEKDRAEKASLYDIVSDVDYSSKN